MHVQTTHCYITLEGNIGAGKSTFLRLLERSCSLPISIVLKTDPERYLYRLRKRGRSEESAIPVLVLDADREFEHSTSVQQEFRESITDFIVTILSRKEINKKEHKAHNIHERVQLCS